MARIVHWHGAVFLFVPLYTLDHSDSLSPCNFTDGLRTNFLTLEVDLSMPSPVATGGGGDHFEEHVAAFLLGLLLVRTTPPILTDTSIVSVHLQTNHLGWRTDDILIIGETSAGERRQLAMQVKRTFNISTTDADCCKTFQGMWQDFQAGHRFNSSRDRLALVTLRATDALLRHFNSLLDCAEAATDSEDFNRRLSLHGHISKRAKSQNNVIRTILKDDAASPLNEDLYWRFLRAINVLSFDLNTKTSQTEAAVLGLLSLSATATSDPQAAARATWAKLIQCAAEGRPKAKSYKRANLPRDLQQSHSAVSTAHSHDLLVLVDHGKTVRRNIRSTIGGTYEIDRSSHVLEIIDQLREDQVVVVSGPAGSGKSALAKHVADKIDSNRPVLAFQAVEFATAHIDETLANAQTKLNGQRLFSLLSGHDKKLILIESVERLLEHGIRDAFFHLLQLALDDQSIQLVITVRDYSLETVRAALLSPVSLVHTVFDVPFISDEELDKIQRDVPSLGPPLRDSQLRSFLRTPYVLDMASRLDWSGVTLPQSVLGFRAKCWKELIKVEHLSARGMPGRREKAFLDIAYRRATELRPFVRPEDPDHEAIDALRRDSLLECPPNSTGFLAVSHDVLEDWAILHWLNDQFAVQESAPSEMAEAVGGYPALRRAFRRWLGEMFYVVPNDTCEFVIRTLGQENLPAYFRDDCLVSALLSEKARDFLEGCRVRITSGDIALLIRIIHILRTACKESPRWLNVPGLPSQMLVATGAGWEPTLNLVSSLLDGLLPRHGLLILGLLEDWATQVAWNTLTPAGIQEAGPIAGALLPQFDGYGQGDARKRLLKVVSKIPQAVPQFGEIVERSRTCDQDDLIASDLAELILGGIFGGHVCQHFPDKVMALVNSRLRLTEADLDRSAGAAFSGRLSVDQNFGIREPEPFAFSPASALQGPFNLLLRLHPRKAVPFIIALLNHAGEWYGTQRWPGRSLEPAWQITLEIPDSGAVRQWMNDRLYRMYRGTSVGPDCLQSALMALESWLLLQGKMDDVDLESWLFYILRESNNVMATGVVASVCIAYPSKARRAGLALLSNRDLIQHDLPRSVTDIVEPLELFTGLISAHSLYEQERKESNGLEHRRKNLEQLAIEMQLLNDIQEDVWRIIDRHRAELSEESAESTRIWRLALHRMDVRGFQPMVTSGKTEEDVTDDHTTPVYLGPGELESDLQTLVEEHADTQSEISRHVQLQNRAISTWRGGETAGIEDWRTSLLSEARAIERELGEPDELWRGGPGMVAAICVRDHLAELNEDELYWCATRIEHEVRSNAVDPDDFVRIARLPHHPDRVCASVVCLLVVDERSKNVLDALDLLSLALTHPVEEVARYANHGVTLFLGEEHKELILLCAATPAYRTRLIAMFRAQERERPRFERTWEFDERALFATRRAFKDGAIDSLVELGSIDLNDATRSIGLRMILEILCQHADWEESREFCSRIVRCLVELWKNDREDRRSRASVNYELQHEILRSTAKFALKLHVDESRHLIAPIIDIVSVEPRKVADFLQELIIAADSNTDDCFWTLWQDIANKMAGAPWANDLDHSGGLGNDLISRLFLGGIQWKDDAKHWGRLDGNAYRLDKIVLQLPAATPCLLAYSRYLYTVGGNSLPEAFRIVDSLLRTGNGVDMVRDSNIALHLESVLRRFVYAQPFRVKSDAGLRDAILGILDALVSSGSSSAYRMRDDFVTPSGHKPI